MLSPRGYIVPMALLFFSWDALEQRALENISICDAPDFLHLVEIQNCYYFLMTFSDVFSLSL